MASRGTNCARWYPVDRIEFTTAYQHAIAGAEIDCLAVEALVPGVFVPVGEKQEEPFDLHALAIGKKFVQASRAQCRQSFEELVRDIEAFLFGQFVEESPVSQSRRPVPHLNWNSVDNLFSDLSGFRAGALTGSP